MNTNRTEKSRDFLSDKTIHKEWESDYLNPEIDELYDFLVGRIIRELGAMPEDDILDAGCGYCYHAIRFANAGLSVTAIDFSPAALAAAATNLAAKKMIDRISLQQSDLRKLAFENDTFSFINCWGVLMHIPEVENALAELARVLKPGGRIAIMENNVRSLHVVVWERIVGLLKQLAGKRRHRRDRTPRGIEEWRDEGLMIRKTDMEWLESLMNRNSCKLITRFPSQLTEIYTAMPTKFGKSLIYRLNHFWATRDLSAKLALGNIVIFQKQRV